MIAPRADTGFTLIEALVAMAVLAVASAGLIHTTESHIDLIGGIESRTIARWASENRLTELRLQVAATLPATVTIVGRNLHVATTSRPSDDPDIAAVAVGVGLEGRQPLVTLRGFHDAGAAGQ